MQLATLLTLATLLLAVASRPIKRMEQKQDLVSQCGKWSPSWFCNEQDYPSRMMRAHGMATSTETVSGERVMKIQARKSGEEKALAEEEERVALETQRLGREKADLAKRAQQALSTDGISTPLVARVENTTPIFARSPLSPSSAVLPPSAALQPRWNSTGLATRNAAPPLARRSSPPTPLSPEARWTNPASARSAPTGPLPFQGPANTRQGHWLGLLGIHSVADYKDLRAKLSHSKSRKQREKEAVNQKAYEIETEIIAELMAELREKWGDEVRAEQERKEALEDERREREMGKEGEKERKGVEDGED